ncbi:MAG: hypothetical protein WC071_14175, partial [Victivallaceae bacterium]
MLAFKLKIASWLLAGLSAFSVIASSPAEPRRVLVEYFFQPNCEECKKISSLVLPRLQEECPEYYRLEKYDLSDEKNFLQLVAILDSLKNNSNHDVYIILDKKLILGGYAAIEQNLFKEIVRLYKTSGTSDVPVAAPSPSSGIAGTFGNKLKITTVIIAGLLDGINPCVFSTLIFFMSLLAVANIKGRKLIILGTVYCLACFLTYLALGFGIFKILQTATVF